jgi:putative peptidoglycan lipid II flippase
MVDRIKSAVHGKQGLKSATFLLMVTLFLSNVLGLLRNIFLATRSTGLGQLDPYYAAFRLPDLIFNILVLGAIASAFIPVYTEVLKTKGESEANKTANTLLGNLASVVLVAIIILWFLAPFFVPWLVKDFSPENIQTTIHLTRVMLLSPFFFCLSYITGAVLNAHKRFLAYGVAPLVYNAAIIVGAILLPRFGIEGVAWSVVGGSFLHLIVQLPTAFVAGYRFSPIVNFKDFYAKKIMKLTIPRTISLATSQVMLLGFTFIAARLHSGALTIFSLSNDLQTTPAIIFGASLATAVFPTLAEAVAEKEPRKFNYYLTRTLRTSIFITVPLMVLCFVLRAQIIRLYIGMGHNVGWGETIRAINTFSWFTFSFLAQAIVFITARAFYALQDTRRPMVAAILGAIVSLTLAWYLPKTVFFSSAKYDVATLAAAYTFGVWTQAVLQLLWLPKNWRGSSGKIFNSLLTSIILSIVMGAVCWVSLRVIGGGLHLSQVDINLVGLGTNTVPKVLLQGLGAALVSAVVYVSLSFAIGADELKWLFKLRQPTDAEQLQSYFEEK